MELRFFLEKLKLALTTNKLKGMESHLKMSPKIGNEPYRELIPKAKYRKSAVLLLILGKSFKDLRILFTLRSSNVQHHKHQISFPGGHCEDGEDEISTALREAKEEIGLEPSLIEILGKLSNLFVPPSETIVVPVVGFAEEFSSYQLNQAEVEELILVPFDFFLNPSNIQIENWFWNGKVVKVPLWKIHSTVPLWGATAMILSEFIDIVQEILESNF